MRFDANIAASGTISAPFGEFNELTVSGQPVSTGTGGGAADSLQDAYDGGDGTIVTTGGKPVNVSGPGGLYFAGEQVAVLSDLTPTSPGEGTTTVSGLITRKLDLSYNPIALWNFDGQSLDDEVSAITLTAVGTTNVGWLAPGIEGVILDGSTAYESTDASLNILGDLTFEALIINGDDAGVAADNRIICGWVGPTGDASDADNFTSRWVLDTSSRQNYFAEGVGGSNISHNGGQQTRVHGFPRRLTHVAMVRENDQVRFYVDGLQKGDIDTGAAAPTGGGNGQFQIGGNTVAALEDAFTGAIASVKVFDKALTDAQILREYERTLTFVESPDDIVAVSGTFSQSLTISGVPVATGTGGGSGDGNITDINAQEGPSITITGTGGIHTLTEGNVITISGSSGSVEAGFRGALMSVSSGTQVATDSAVPIGWDTPEYDTDGFFDAGQPNRLTIPAGISKVRLSAQYRYAQSTNGDRRIIMRKNDSGSLNQDPSDGQVIFVANAHATEDSGIGTIMHAASPVMEVQEGDYFSTFARQGAGVTIELFSAASWWQLEVLDPVSVSGTVSGSASTLQEAYDNGDGVITTVAGKPLFIVGDEYDGNVDFQVTGSGKFTEGLSVGSGTTFITGDKIETPQLLVNGSEVLTQDQLTEFSGEESLVSGTIGRHTSVTQGNLALWKLDGDLTDSAGLAGAVDDSKSYERRHLTDNVGNFLGAYANGSEGYQGPTDSNFLITGDITVGGLILAGSHGSFGRMIVGYGVFGDGTEAANFQWSLATRTGGILRWFQESGAGTGHTYDSTDTLEEGQLYHVMAVRESQTITMYVNGEVFAGPSTALTTPTGGTTALINVNFFSASTGDATMGSVKVIDRALSASEIYEEYRSTWSEVNLPELLLEGSTTASGVIGRKLDTTHNPVALYLFEGNGNDSSGNGFHMTAGTAYQRTYLEGGLQGHRMDGNQLERTGTANDAALTISGDITIQAIATISELDGTTNPLRFLHFAASGETEATNAQWSLGLQGDGKLFWAQEHTGGVDQNYTAPDTTRVTTGSTYLIGATRTSGVIQFYVNGEKWGPPSSALTTPTGGTSAFIKTGNGTTTSKFALGCAKVIDSSLTPAEMYAEYERTWRLSSLSGNSTPAFRGCLLTTSSGSSVATGGSLKTIPFDTASFDTDGILDTGSNTIVMPAGVGYARFTGNLSWSSNTTGRRQAQIYINGGVFDGVIADNRDADTVSTGNFYSNAQTAVVSVSPGDEVEIRVFQDSGSTLTVDSSVATWFQVEILG